MPTHGVEMSDVEGLPGARLFTPGTLEHVHWLSPIDDPGWRSAQDALHMRPQDVVLGIAFDGKAWALPWWIMKNHHVANLVLAGRPLLVTFCEVCSSGAAFDPQLDGERMRFRLAGLYQGTNLAVDDRTGSFWAPSIGEAVHGPLKGKRLERVPAFQSEWQQWLALHPDTLIFDVRDLTADPAAASPPEARTQ